MSDDKVKFKGSGQNFNRELGGKYEYQIGGEIQASDKNAGPNAHAHAGVETNDLAIKMGAGADAEAFYLHGDHGVEAKAFGVEAGAEAEAGATGVSAEADAKATLVEAEGAGMGVRLGAGVSTGAGIGAGGVKAKFLGTGFTIGKKTSISVFDNEVSINFAKLGKALKFWDW